MTKLSRRRFLALGGAALLGVGGIAVFKTTYARAALAEVMTPPEAFAAAETGDILIVDIRRPDEWAQTGIPTHAVGIDMRAEDFLVQLAAARRSETQPVALICARGVRSARMTKRLEDAGVGPIIDIPEGMLGSFSGPGWVKRGLPVSK